VKKHTSVKVNVKQPEGKEPVPVDVIATSIQKIAEGIERINSSQVNRRCVIVLLADYTKVSRSDIVKVLDGLASLKAVYLK
jgi:hypothetical protein